MKDSHRSTLVPRNEILDGFETPIVPDIHAMSRLLYETDAFLKTHVADSAVVFAIEVSTEELLKNIISYGYVKYGKRRSSIIACRLCQTMCVSSSATTLGLSIR